MFLQNIQDVEQELLFRRRECLILVNLAAGKSVTRSWKKSINPFTRIAGLSLGLSSTAKIARSVGKH